MRRGQQVVVGVAALSLCVVAAACGGDDASPAASVTPSPPITAPDTAPVTTAPATSSPATTAPATSAPATTPPTTRPPEVAVVAWPPAGRDFATPEAVAADFTARVFGQGAVLGAFRAGDSRSGEIEVFASDETGRPIGEARSTLLLRQVVGDSWSVTAAVSDGATITTPAAGDTVTGTITVSGRARGFEANVNVRAIAVDDPANPLDEEITMAGSLDRLLPYEVTLDLSAATPASVVLVVVRGGVGLETDPGDTAVIPVVIG